MESPTEKKSAKKKSKDTLPLNFLTEGKSALVVGGGLGAYKKLKALLSSQMETKLVAPEICSEVLSLECSYLKIEKRPYSSSDLQNVDLVYAVTDNEELNHQIIQEARTRKILCCLADRNWSKGDVITPAVIRSGDIVISISTGGRSCTEAKAIREFLELQLAQYQKGKSL